MLEYTIDLTGVSDFREMYRCIYSSMEGPDDYGANADALWDILSEPFGGTVHFTLRGVSGLTKTALRKSEKMLEVFADAAKRIEGFTYTVES